MLLTPRPQVSIDEVFNACCRSIRDTALKGRVESNYTKVLNDSVNYSIAGLSGSLRNLNPSMHRPMGSATSDDFEWLYETRLVKCKEGRPFYKGLRDGNNERCALCNVRPATTLDHHLPKSEFPVLSVTPDNLLPACDTCNRIKLADMTPTLNTYFDDLGPGQWLKVRIIETAPYTLVYWIQPQPQWSSDMTARAYAHFKLFGLQKLYAAQAIRHLSGLRMTLRKLLRDVGSAGVKQSLEESAASFMNAEPNGWEGAVLSGAASSDWFCSGGFDS